MPWQQLVADVGGEIDPDTGYPAYREVAITVPRQSGKTTLILSWQVQRAIGWGHLGSQRIAYSAQTGLDARKKLIEDQVPLLEPRKTVLGIRRILKGMGQESIEWRNGSRLVLLASTEEAGHGKTLDLAAKDEFFADDDDRRDQSIIPAMATRPYGQVLTLSTAGTERSLPLNRLIDRGRTAVESGRRGGIAYFEWSAPPEADPDDPAVWWDCMPALGYTISEDVVRQAREAMSDSEFRRAFLNVATTSDDRIIPSQAWDAVCLPDAAPSGALTFGVDIDEDRTGGAIVACGARTLELVHHEPGVGWLIDYCVQVDKAAGGGTWAVDSGGPAASLIPDLQSRGLRVEPCAPAEFTQACGQFYDAVADRTVTVRRDQTLDRAVAGAGRRVVGDRWAWSRRSGQGDISPVVAATLALWCPAAGAPTFEWL